LKECLGLFTISCNGQLKVETREIRLSYNMIGVRNIEDVTNLVLSCFCSCCCKSNNLGCGAELLFNHLMQHKVGRSEVVRPLTSTMDLVNTYHRDLSFELAEVLHEEAFRSNEQHFDLLLLYSLDYRLSNRMTLLRVQ
jgi:hypothetical protein